MTKKEFYELTGENPEDMFGGDWKNEIEELENKLNQVDLEERIANEIEEKEDDWAEMHCTQDENGGWQC